MSRIKPHGPVSPHFMNHYYGAAKPAPVSDDTALLRRALDALEYMNVTAEHRVDQRIPDAAIAALRERLGEKA